MFANQLRFVAVKVGSCTNSILTNKLSSKGGVKTTQSDERRGVEALSEEFDGAPVNKVFNIANNQRVTTDSGYLSTLFKYSFLSQCPLQFSAKTVFMMLSNSGSYSFTILYHSTVNIAYSSKQDST